MKVQEGSSGNLASRATPQLHKAEKNVSYFLINAVLFIKCIRVVRAACSYTVDYYFTLKTGFRKAKYLQR